MTFIFESLVPIFLWLIFLLFGFSKNIFCLRKVYLQKMRAEMWKVMAQSPWKLSIAHCTKAESCKGYSQSQACVFGVTNSLPRLQPAKAMVKACTCKSYSPSLDPNLFCNKVAKATRIFQRLQPSLASNLLVGKGLQLITACTGYSQATKKPAKAAACTG